MSRTVILSHDYAAPAQKVWELVTSFDALAKVNAGNAHFVGLPEGRTYTGQEVEVMVSMFGIFPARPYFMKITLCDEQAMMLQSEETGNGVKSWQHALHVMVTDTGCKLIDRVEVDAGFLTPLFAAFARYLYGSRHKPRLQLLGLDTAPSRV